MSLRTNEALCRNDTNRKLPKTLQHPNGEACKLRTRSQRDVNCADNVEPRRFPYICIRGLVMGAEVPAALPLTQPI